ncbi:unnamed protein product [Thlaspi arvense]|uniref:Uncharacterized protein n=1 Tax=Thlaspi arvense TaxID=13288 RepID=A0AAU9S3M5_THLAR|nr:unnamed protein product [Thlaspi arvense]
MRKKRCGEEGHNEYKKGLWTVEEDKILMDYVKAHGKGHWNRIAKKTGQNLSLSNLWSLIARRVPGRTDNQVKNYWNTHLSKKIEIKDQAIKPINHHIINLGNMADPSEERLLNVKFNDKNVVGDDNSLMSTEGIGLLHQGNNYTSSSLWGHHEDAFELSTLTYMMDFSDGRCY